MMLYLRMKNEVGSSRKKGILMRKTIKLEDLDCANCAAKLENAISKLDGVTSCSVSFMTQKMVLEAPDDRYQEVFGEVKKLAARLEPDMTILG